MKNALTLMTCNSIVEHSFIDVGSRLVPLIIANKFPNVFNCLFYFPFFYIGDTLVNVGLGCLIQLISMRLILALSSLSFSKASQ